MYSTKGRLVVRVQRLETSTGETSWTVLGDDHLPVPAIESFLGFLADLGRSPNTVRTYAFALKAYFSFLAATDLAWETVRLEDVGEFAGWLRRPAANVIPFSEEAACRSARTIDTMLAAVTSFYEFQARNGCDVIERITCWRKIARRGYKPFLHHVTKSMPQRTRLVKVRTSRRLAEVLSQDDVQQILNACTRLRDRFLFALLYETGMRVGQALGLRHEDMHTWDRKIWIVPRDDNPADARSKSSSLSYAVDISGDLVDLYADYMVDEYGDVDSDFVFTNLFRPPVGARWRYSSVEDVVRRIRGRTGIRFSPHVFRHTHATELLRTGVRMELVAKRFGHASVQTTIDTYSHLNVEDLREELGAYWANRGVAITIGAAR